MSAFCGESAGGEQLARGLQRLQEGRFDEAAALCRAAAGSAPADAEAHAALGTALHMLGRHDEAITAFATALAVDPGRAESLYGLALALHATQRHDEAIACYRRALAIDPDYAEASCGLGGALVATGRADLAVTAFELALDIDGDYVEALCGLAEAQQALHRDDDAIATCRRALAVQPGFRPAQRALGMALRRAGQQREALEWFRTVLAGAPDDAQLLADLAGTLEELGQLDAAQATFRQAVARDPGNVQFAFALVMAARVRADDPILATLKAFEDRSASLAARDRTVLHFALAKALSDLGRNDEAFDHLLVGNSLHRQTIRYDEAAVIGVLERLRSTFTADLLRSRARCGLVSPVPIFIVGMPRSGSTLIEQILASHPRIFGAGERPDFALALREAGIDPAGPAVAALDGGRLAALGADYLDRLEAAARRQGAEAPRRITDKMPANYFLLGLIHLALPEARIIHCRRDPVETCLSCFSKLFAEEQPFAYDLGELGRYYRAYARAMEHWHSVLPPGVILDVHYEALVADFEAQARRMVAHCGLEWDARCLSFHESDRAVRTASATQVRQPIYGSPGRRWRPAEDVLRPLLDGLGPQ